MFRPYVLHGDLLIISGQLPVATGKPSYIGRVPDAVSVERAKEAATLCTINVLAWVKHACGSDFDRVVRCIRLGGFVNAAPGFYDAPSIINTASQMINEAFGERGAHARVALGVASLPFDAPVEIEATFAIRP
jgi:enamine deaminase RidA (YjgF/YER057c/UK114 family)